MILYLSMVCQTGMLRLSVQTAEERQVPSAMLGEGRDHPGTTQVVNAL